MPDAAEQPTATPPLRTWRPMAAGTGRIAAIMRRKFLLLAIGGAVIAALAACLLVLRPFPFFSPFPWDNSAKIHSRCFLYLAPTYAPYRTEVIINNEALGTFQVPARAEWRKQVIVFRANGPTHVVFRIFREDCLLYAPEFSTEIVPGDMIEFDWRTAEKLFVPGSGEKLPVPEYGPTPSYSFPALADGVPPMVWCCFESANASKEAFIVTLRSGEDLSALKRKLFWRRYKVIGGSKFASEKNPWVRVRPAGNTTVVEAVLEMRQWSEVLNAEPAIARIY